MGNYTTHDPVLRQRYAFSQEGDVLSVQIEIEPGGEVPDHLHPALTERWQVLEGEVTFTVEGEDVVPPVGEVVEVGPGVRHRFANRSDAVAVALAEVSPPMDTRAFLEQGAALNAGGGLTARGTPKSWSGLLAAAAFVERFQDTIVLFLPFPAPPRPVQRLLFPRLARLHARRAVPSRA